ncbi:MAG: hypothetical protein AB2A00_42220 [Myxococcota bacterium]
MRASVVILALFSAACAPPWELLETNDTARTMWSVWRAPSGAVLVGADNAGILRRAPDGPVFEPVSIAESLTGEPAVEDQVVGLQGPSDVDVYAWTPTRFLHSTGGSFRVLPPPEDGTPWQPLTVVTLSESDVLVTSTTPDDGDVLFQKFQEGWTRARFSDGTFRQLDWVAASSSGQVFAGHGREGRQTLVRRSGNTFEPVSGFAISGVRRAAVTSDRLWTLTERGVQAVRLDNLSTEDTDVFLPGAFYDICAFPSGRVGVAGPSRGPLQPVWIFENGQWTNANVGTREVLRGIHCGGDGRLYVAGDHGMLAREPSPPG